MLNIFLFGPAGSGKGTQANIISKKFNLDIICAGDILREECKNTEGKHYQIIQDNLKNGKLVPHQVVNKLIEERIDESVNRGAAGILYDGFPREMKQNDFLSADFKKRNWNVGLIIYLSVVPENLIKRLESRYTCKTCGKIYNKISSPTKVENVCDVCQGSEFLIRNDDINREAILSRFNIFETESKLVLDQYDDSLVLRIDASKPIEEISEIISDKIKSLI